MKLTGVFTQRYRGFRVVDLTALVAVLLIAFAVYAFKTLAGAQSADTVQVEKKIADEERRVRLLQAEEAHLQSPDRLERLSGDYLGLKAPDARHEVTPEALSQIADKGSTP